MRRKFHDEPVFEIVFSAGFDRDHLINYGPEISAPSAFVSNNKQSLEDEKGRMIDERMMNVTIKIEQSNVMNTFC